MRYRTEPCTPLRRLYLVAAGLILAALITPSAVAQQAPTDVIRDYQEAIVQTTRGAERLGYHDRYERLEPAIRRAYDLPFIAKRSIGSRRWDDLSEAQRERYVDAFSRFTIATHASRFSDYTGEGFRREGVQELPRGYVLVKSELVKSDGDTIPINYQMTERDGQWQIVDVFLRGTISEVATRRSEFSAVMDRSGFEGLISSLEERIQRARER